MGGRQETVVFQRPSHPGCVDVGQNHESGAQRLKLGKGKERTFLLRTFLLGFDRRNWTRYEKGKVNNFQCCRNCIPNSDMLNRSQFIQHEWFPVGGFRYSSHFNPFCHSCREFPSAVDYCTKMFMTWGNQITHHEIKAKCHTTTIFFIL